MTRARARRAVRLLLAALLGLATLEAGLRVVAATGHSRFASTLREWDPEATLELRGAHCFRPWPGSVVRFPNGSTSHVNASGFRGPAVATPKPPGTYRVVLLGGSTSHGFLVDDDETIDAHLRQLLHVPNATRVEAVNLGFDALDAPCEQERLATEGVALEPDAVIVHTGINDVPALRASDLGPDDPRRGYRPARRASEERRRRETGPWRAVKHWSFAARLPGVLRNLTVRPAPLPGPSEPDQRALEDFARTVRETIALVPPEAPVLLSMPPSRIDLPGLAVACPVIVDAATTRRYRERVAERLRRVATEERARGRDVRWVPHDLPDAVFLDDCHVDDEGNRLLAADFARALEAAPRAVTLAQDAAGTAPGAR